MEAGMKDIETATDIEHLVNSFYADVRRDDTLGPVFNSIIGEDWSHHLPLLYGFWSMVLLGTSGYTGQVIAKHIAVHQKMPLSEAHFSRWLQLWDKTLDRSFSGPRADEARKRARLMMDLIRLKLDAYKPGSTLV
jgi:hemoglobin